MNARDAFCQLVTVMAFGALEPCLARHTKD